MNLKIKRLIKKYLPFPLLFKQALNFAIIFQLSTYPYLTHANSAPNTPSDKKLTEADNFNKQVESLRDHIFEKRDSSTDYTSHSLDVFGLLGQKIFDSEEVSKAPKASTISKISNKIKKFPLPSSETPIKLQNIIVEIVKDIAPEENIQNPEIIAVLPHPSQQDLAGKILPQKQVDKLGKNSVFISGADEEKLSFRFSFHGKVVQSFPQNIKWMAFVNNYLIFLEASKVQSKKAIISFIDLRYFEPAIGKTALPIFHIPVAFTEQITAESLLFPPHLRTQDELLSIGEGLTLSAELLDFISNLQQLVFNTTVSLLQTENSHITQEYLREIVKAYYENNPYQASSPDETQISEKIKELTLKILENRVQMGSTQNPSGVNGQLNKLAFTLPSGDPIADEFKENLKIDKNFQNEISKTHSQMTGQRKLLTRFLALKNHLIRPQPLGSPQITKALGLIANSVSLKGDTVENRLMAFKELLKQSIYPKGSQTALIVGAGLLGGTTLWKFNIIQKFSADITELLTVTSQSASTWIYSPSAIYSTYIEGNNLSHFLTGLIALFGIIVVSIGIPHLLVNSFNLGKNMKRQKDIQMEVKSSWKRFKSSFIDIMSKERSGFFESLSKAQRKKIGIDVFLSGIHYAFKTTNNLSAFESAVKDPSRSLTLTLQVLQDENTVAFKFESSNQVYQAPLKENQISLKINGSERIFSSSNGINLSDIVNKATNLELSGDNLQISGVLQNAEFTNEENKRLADIFNEIEKERSSQNSSQDNNLSQKEITTLKQAFVEFLFGYSSWTKTFRFLGLGWNGFFLSRHIATSPSSLSRILYYSQYFKVVKEGHSPSLFNGGHQNRLSRTISLAQTKFQFTKLKQFEEQITRIEKTILEEVAAQAYLALVEKASLNNQPETASLPFNLKIEDIKNKRLRIFYKVYQQTLYHVTIKEYLHYHIMRSNYSPDEVSDHKLKIKVLKQLIEDPELLENVNKEKIKQIVRNNTQAVKQKSTELTDGLIKEFFKIRAIAGEERSKNNLNPKKSLQMKRSEISRISLNDPEALARATRQQITYFMIDKPIELIYKFLFLLGADQGILQILHDQAFTEDAWFHLSRYAIWSGFFGNLILEILAGTWFKTQMDARLFLNTDVDSLPDKTEAEKGYLRWIWKQFKAEDNSLWKNYKEAITIAYANLLPGLILMGTMYGLTLGRFDIEVLVALYLAYFLTPFYGIRHKLENTFEKSADFGYKELIKRGLDLQGDDKKFLSHPLVQEHYLKESSKLRRRFNLGLALGYNNIIENILEILQNTNTTSGSRALVRSLMPADKLPTEHLVNFINFLERNGLPSGVADTCKSIFTNNRPDIKIK